MNLDEAIENLQAIRLDIERNGGDACYCEVYVEDAPFVGAILNRDGHCVIEVDPNYK